MVLAEVVETTTPPRTYRYRLGQGIVVVGQEDPQGPVRFARKGKAP